MRGPVGWRSARLFRLWVAAAAAPAAGVTALYVVDLRAVPGEMGFLLLGSLIVAAVAGPAVMGARCLHAGRRTVGGVLVGVAVGAFALGLWVWRAVGDGHSAVVLLGFGLALCGLPGVVLAVVCLAMALFRRRGRAVAGGSVLAAVGVVAVAATGVTVVAPRPPAVPSMSSPAAVDGYLRGLVATGGPPGISVVVVKDGRVVYDKAFGLADGTRAAPATPQTVYHWFSVTKPVTAAAALKLVERGLIRLDDPVEKYLPFFTPRYPSPHSRRITVADLLNHSSGLPSNEPWVVSWVHGEDEPALDQTAFIRRKLPDFDRLGFEPGSRASYTNMDYYVLAAVIEKASGRPYREYVEDEVLRPLGMHDTGFAYTPAMRAHESAGSLDLASAQTAFLPLVRPPWPTELIRGYQDGRAWFERFLFDGDAASGLIGSAPDMARFVAALLDEGKLDGAQVLSAGTVATMLNSRQVTPAASPETAGYPAGTLKLGLGWFAVRNHGTRYLEHSGGGAGFASLVRLYPERHLGIVLVANGTQLAGPPLADAMAEVRWGPTTATLQESSR